jgi:chorismate mutase/prephenate dehydrogenase
MIDAIDREILQSLSRRYALVGEIARYKREHRLAIRDFAREAEILGDRCRRAGQLGLSPELIESLFRLVLWGSRDRQAALKAEVPLDIEPKSVAIIGGRGAMGRCLADLFGDLGHAVMVADLSTPLSSEDAAAVADVVVISVPIDATVDVVRRLGPLLRADALLADVTSVKVGPMTAMLESFAGSVVGTHPLFAPSVHSLQGQRVVLCRGRGDEWFRWLETMLHARGLVLMEATPAAHDQAMAIVQVLVHFATEVMGQTLARLKTDLGETLRFTSPVYLMELIMTARHFAQSPDLYASIQMSNPGTHEVTEAFARAAEELQRVVAEKDHDEFQRQFNEVREFFGSFTTQALEQSSYLIDRLVERT